MYSDLDKLDWATMESGSGAGTDVPDLIRGLYADDPDRRLEQYVELFDHLWHQGHVYESSLHAIPFLVAALQSSRVPEKSRIALLIGEIATGSTPLHSVKNDGANWTQILAKQGRSIDDELAKEQIVMDSIHQEVDKALPQLTVFLDDPDPSVRRVIAAVLSRFQQHSSEHLLLLRKRMERESDLSVREEITRSIDRLS